MSPNTTPFTGRRALTLAGSLTIAAGAAHLVIAFIGYKPFFLHALWFAGTGVAIVLIGILTLFARGTPAGSIERWVAVGANAAGFIIAASYSAFTGWREPRGYAEMALFLVGAIAAMVGGQQASAAVDDGGQRRV